MYFLPASLLDPDPVAPRDRVVLVREERERELVLVAKLRVRSLAVRAHAENDSAALLELAPGVADAAGLLLVAGRVVLGIEVEDDRFPRSDSSETSSPESLCRLKGGADCPSSIKIFSSVGCSRW